MVSVGYRQGNREVELGCFLLLLDMGRIPQHILACIHHPCQFCTIRRAGVLACLVCLSWRQRVEDCMAFGEVPQFRQFQERTEELGHRRTDILRRLHIVRDIRCLDSVVFNLVTSNKYTFLHYELSERIPVSQQIQTCGTAR